MSRRYTVLIADRSTGAVSRFTIKLRPALTIVTTILALPMLVGLGLRWSAVDEIAGLQISNATLELENASFRAATEDLTDQISTLQAAIADVGERAALDPSSVQALDKLPALVRSRAMGGATTLTPPRPNAFSSAVLSPENTFGIIRDLLGSLETSLDSVRSGVERRQALAAATPSIWPARGWLNDTFGTRKDPFTGLTGFHAGVDICNDKGEPVYATADGEVESTSYSGAYGNLAVIKHEFGMVTRYGHLSRFAVKPGDRVKRGDVVGYMGSTGRTTGPHLHYEVWANGKPINPLSLLTNKRP